MEANYRPENSLTAPASSLTMPASSLTVTVGTPKRAPLIERSTPDRNDFLEMVEACITLGLDIETCRAGDYWCLRAYEAH